MRIERTLAAVIVSSALMLSVAAPAVAESGAAPVAAPAVAESGAAPVAASAVAEPEVALVGSTTQDSGATPVVSTVDSGAATYAREFVFFLVCFLKGQLVGSTFPLC
ncbi:hypothetical protein [Nocardia sp. NPDC050175]|uniref:hypothetical protein n=1 Tax=Nocardia sp. NPDC050175 TaxID=3364317 RepID=UPI0037BDFBD5